MSWVTRRTVRPSLREDPLEVLLEGGAHEGIKRTEGLVEKKDLGLEHQGTHEADALPLAAAQFGRVAVKGVFGQASEIGKLTQPCVDAARLQVARHQGDVLAGGEVGEKAAVLDDVADLPAAPLPRSLDRRLAHRRSPARRRVRSGRGRCGSGWTCRSRSGPMRAVTPPSATSRSVGWSATRSPYRFVTPWRWIISPYCSDYASSAKRRPRKPCR